MTTNTWDHNVETLRYLETRITEQSEVCEKEWKTLCDLKKKAHEIKQTLGITPISEDFDEFKEFVDKVAKEHPESLCGPGFYIKQEGHLIQFFWEKGGFVGKWINHHLTLYESWDGQVIGCSVYYPPEWKPYRA